MWNARQRPIPSQVTISVHTVLEFEGTNEVVIKHTHDLYLVYIFYWHVYNNKTGGSQRICRTKITTQDNILDSARTMPDSWKTTHSGFLLRLQLQHKKREQSKKAFLWYTHNRRTAIVATGQEAKWPGKPLKFNTNKATHWRVALRFP